VLAGILPHLIERLMAGESSTEAATRPARSVGSIFDAAAREGIPTVVLRGVEGLGALPFAPDPIARLRAALSAGLVAIVPQRPPEGSDGRVGWWLVDPSNGRTVDEMDNGSGTVDEYAATVRVTVVETARPMRDLGICVAIVFLTAAATLATIGALAGTAVAASKGQGLAAGLLGASGVVGSGTIGGLLAGEAAGTPLVAC
jgi:hypothetical protein